MKAITIVIPCYEYSGLGAGLLEHLFFTLKIQSFKDFDVVVSDQSLPENRQIENMCDSWQGALPIRYLKNDFERGNAASNFNYGMLHATGDYIKFLCQDDYLFDDLALQATFDALNQEQEKNWLASTYAHVTSEGDNNFVCKNFHYPRMNDKIYIVNTIGSPSGITIKNFGYVMPIFDTKLSYAYDCDFYYRFRGAYGEPIILDRATVANFLWDGSTTSGVDARLIEKENRYILDKYGFGK